jgi:hypothetical protein
MKGLKTDFSHHSTRMSIERINSLMKCTEITTVCQGMRNTYHVRVNALRGKILLFNVDAGGIF